MVSNKINNMTQLKLEIIRLQSIKAQQEIIIKENFKAVKESLKPANLGKSIFSSLVADKKDTQNFLMYGINKGIGYGINFLAEKLFLKDKPGIVKTIGHFLINNVVSKIVSFNSGSSLISILKNIFQGKNRDDNDSSMHKEVYNNHTSI